RGGGPPPWGTAPRSPPTRRPDRFVVVERGKSAGRGPHAAFLPLRGRYHDLYPRQHGLEENLFLAPGEGDKVEEKAGAAGARGAAVPDPMSLIRGQGF